MAVGARTQAGISIAIARDPSLVRTVRLVAAAVARRASADEELVEEVRLAVGEACAVMVSGLVGSPLRSVGESGVAVAGSDKIMLQLDIAERLTVSIACATDGADPVEGPLIDPWALLRGLVEDLLITQRDGALSLSMSWPL